MKSDVCLFTLSFVLINYCFTATGATSDLGYGKYLGKRRPSFYKYRRGPRLGRHFLDFICDSHITKDAQLDRLACVSNTGPMEFKTILQRCMRNATSIADEGESLNRLCNQPEVARRMNNCFFMAERSPSRPNHSRRPPVIPTEDVIPEVYNNELPGSDLEGERNGRQPADDPEENIVKRHAPYFRRRNQRPDPCVGNARGYGCRTNLPPYGGFDPLGPPPMGGGFAPHFPPPPHAMGPGFGGPSRRLGPPFFPPRGPDFHVPMPPPAMPPAGVDPFTRLIEGCRAQYPA